jgi:hypothetical protein
MVTARIMSTATLAAGDWTIRKVYRARTSSLRACGRSSRFSTLLLVKARDVVPSSRRAARADPGSTDTLGRDRSLDTNSVRIPSLLVSRFWTLSDKPKPAWEKKGPR